MSASIAGFVLFHIFPAESLGESSSDRPVLPNALEYLGVGNLDEVGTTRVY